MYGGIVVYECVQIYLSTKQFRNVWYTVWSAHTKLGMQIRQLQHTVTVENVCKRILEYLNTSRHSTSKDLETSHSVTLGFVLLLLVLSENCWDNTLFYSLFVLKQPHLDMVYQQKLINNNKRAFRNLHSKYWALLHYNPEVGNIFQKQ